jgi:hypothetical protein
MLFEFEKIKDQHGFIMYNCFELTIKATRVLSMRHEYFQSGKRMRMRITNKLSAWTPQVELTIIESRNYEQEKNMLHP